MSRSEHLELMTPKAVSARMRLLRKAWEGDNTGAQTRFAKWLGIGRRRWANIENNHPLSKDVAFRLAIKTGAPLDWIYRGIEGGLMPETLAKKLRDAQKD